MVESLRIVLAIIICLLVTDSRTPVPNPLLMAVLGFSTYAVVLLWRAAHGDGLARGNVFYWVDAVWFLLLLSLVEESRTQYFLFLYFPVFFASTRTSYRESLAIAAFSALASVLVFALREPDASWFRMVMLPLSLILIEPLFLSLARLETATRKGQDFASELQDRLDPRRNFESIVSDLMPRIGELFGASAAILALRTCEGRCRAFCWEAGDGSSELSEGAAAPIVEQALSLAPKVAFGWSQARRWLLGERHIGYGPSGLPVVTSRSDRNTLMALAQLLGKPRILTVPLHSSGIGSIRLMLSGGSIGIDAPSLAMLAHIAEKIGPALENAQLREQLVTEAADTERARIGRDLHDSAIQPYIGLKFGIEALQRRAGEDNPIAPELARLAEMASEELASLRETVSGLRGTPGKGGTLLSTAVRRQAARFGQLFGIQVKVDIDGEMPVSRRIAGELFHIVAEGLSNIRRHTNARQAWISLSAEDDSLVLRIRNETDSPDLAGKGFTPASLTQRAADLHGLVQVECTALNTTVSVRVPISPSKSKHTRHDHQHLPC